MAIALWCTFVALVLVGKHAIPIWERRRLERVPDYAKIACLERELGIGRQDP